MSNRLHLTQVPWATIDYPCVWATLFGVHHHFSSSGKSTEFGAGNYSQPGVGGSLRHRQNKKREWTVWLKIKLSKWCRGLPNTHLDDSVDRERLCCTFPVRHQQLQTPVTVKVCGYSTWRAITLMMQLNTSGNSLHNSYHPNAGKHGHNVAAVTELTMWNKSLFLLQSTWRKTSPVEHWCHLMVRHWNSRYLSLLMLRWPVKGESAHQFHVLQALTPPRRSALLSGGLHVLSCSPCHISITAVTHGIK